jgi:hypothetical protein
VASLDRERLVALLEANPAGEARGAVEALQSEAPFTYEIAMPHPGAHFAKIYRRRADWVRRKGFDVRGLDEAADRFDEAEEIGGIAFVHAEDRHYIVFLTPGAGRVVACTSSPAN